MGGRRDMGFNPLRSEAEAFRMLVWVAVVFVTIIAVVLIVRALT